MEELDKTLKELATGLIFATLIFTIIALFMIRFGFNRPNNDIWNCLLFSLKGCVCGWFYLWGRYSAKELLRARVVLSDLKQKHSEEKFKAQTVQYEDKFSSYQFKLEDLKLELETSKRREEALIQKLTTFTRTPADANQNALKGFL